MGQAFDLLAAEGIVSQTLALRMRGAVGFRNVAVHTYEAIDWDIVHTIAHRGLENFRDFAKSMAALV